MYSTYSVMVYYPNFQPQTIANGPAMLGTGPDCQTVCPGCDDVEYKRISWLRASDCSHTPDPNRNTLSPPT